MQLCQVTSWIHPGKVESDLLCFATTAHYSLIYFNFKKLSCLQYLKASHAIRISVEIFQPTQWTEDSPLGTYLESLQRGC